MALLAGGAATALARESVTMKWESFSSSVTSCTTKVGSDQFAVQSRTFGATDPVSLISPGSQAGKPSLSNVAIVKLLDECSTQLFGLAVQGIHIAKAVLTWMDASGKTILLSVELDGAIVTSYQLAGSTPPATPAENVSFADSKITISDYGASGVNKFGWDAVANKAI
jgi:type VI protein secretion system component Hcp